MRLTIDSVMKVMQASTWRLVDNRGRTEEVPTSVLYTILGVGWLSYFLAWTISLLYYILHPSKGQTRD